MNIVAEFRRDASRVLDRLVDGELGQHERRELLASLDDEPGAWRQCALTFLEAQNWRLQLSRFASEPLVAQVTATPRDAVVPPALPAQPSRSGSLGTILAIAASLLVAFGIGTRFPSFADDGTGRSALVAKQNDAGNEQAGGTPAKESSQHDSRPELNETAAPLQTLTLQPTGDDHGEPIELPLIESDADGVIAASAQPSALSGSLISQFEKDGFVVDRQQRLWPVDLPDGRRVLVPVEEVDIRSPLVERL
jgi:hypothetical protein